MLTGEPSLRILVSALSGVTLTENVARMRLYTPGQPQRLQGDLRERNIRVPENCLDLVDVVRLLEECHGERVALMPSSA